MKNNIRLAKLKLLATGIMLLLLVSQVGMVLSFVQSMTAITPFNRFVISACIITFVIADLLILRLAAKVAKTLRLAELTKMESDNAVHAIGGLLRSGHVAGAKELADRFMAAPARGGAGNG